MDETWLRHYDPKTKQQSMEWRHSGSPRPAHKISGCRNRLVKFLPWFFGIKMASTTLIIFQRSKLWTRSGAGVIEWYFEGKTPWEFHQACLVTLLQCPVTPDTCYPKQTGLPELPLSWSPTLFTGSGTVGLKPVSWTEKSIEKSPFTFRHWGHCCRGDLVGRSIFWVIFVLWNPKFRATG
jgi:hypothetical protein